MNQADQQNLHASYTLKGKGEIMERLRLLERQKTFLTATPSGQTSGFITTILKIIPEKRVIAIDATSNEHLNNVLLNSKSVVFSAQVNGVHARFSTESVIPAQLDGQAVFAIPIPDSLYWLERRQFYRLVLPYALPVKCKVSLSEDRSVELPVADISLTGLALVDSHRQFDRDAPIGSLFVNCHLDLPVFSGEKFALNLRNVVSQPGHDGSHESFRLGFALEGCSRELEIQLQKFLFEVELQIKKSHSLSKA